MARARVHAKPYLCDRHQAANICEGEGREWPHISLSTFGSMIFGLERESNTNYIGIYFIIHGNGGIVATAAVVVVVPSVIGGASLVMRIYICFVVGSDATALGFINKLFFIGCLCSVILIEDIVVWHSFFVLVTHTRPRSSIDWM